uniref:Uncharacterized protein n=1 Tax=Rhizophora mucronata TaxID=61149 RepID=A0A2P2NKR5_RHIMU
MLMLKASASTKMPFYDGVLIYLMIIFGY